MSELLLDIVNLPPEHIRQQVGQAIKKAAAGKDVVYIVDNEKLIPHQSLFHIKIAEEKLGEVEKRVQEIIKHYHPFEIHSIGLKEKGTPALLLSNPSQLEKLHKEMVEGLKDLRSGEMPWTPDREPNDLEREYREQYGTQHVLKRFNPHFTLAKFKNKSDWGEVANRIEPLKLSYQVDTIAVTEVNFFHQVTRIVKEFRLG